MDFRFSSKSSLSVPLVGGPEAGGVTHQICTPRTLYTHSAQPRQWSLHTLQCSLRSLAVTHGHLGLSSSHHPGPGLVQVGMTISIGHSEIPKAFKAFSPNSLRNKTSFGGTTEPN